MSVFPDPFDVAMNATVSIYEKGVGSVNSYNQPDQVLNKVLTAWPCRLTIERGGNKYMKGKEYAHRMYLLFMRPPINDDNGNPFTLNEHYWAIVTTPGDGAELKLNIENVLDPSGLGHHLECKAEMVLP
jgi:hypothetical protein